MSEPTPTAPGYSTTPSCGRGARGRRVTRSEAAEPSGGRLVAGRRLAPRPDRTWARARPWNLFALLGVLVVG